LITKLRTLVCLCVFCQALHLSGQEEVVIEGQILNDTIEKTELNIVNLGLKIGTITDLNGAFKIRARISDTINISGVQYEVLASKIKPQITAASLGLPVNARPIMTPEERRFYGATGGAGPLGSLINAISGRTKMLKKYLEISMLQAKIERNRNKFSDSLYMKQLNIPEVLIEDFVYYVFEDEEAINAIDKENLLELLNLMLSKSDAYLKTKENEGAIDMPIKN